MFPELLRINQSTAGHLQADLGGAAGTEKVPRGQRPTSPGARGPERLRWDESGGSLVSGDKNGHYAKSVWVPSDVSSK